MSNILESKIKTIFENNPDHSGQLEISIECPLDSSISVIGKWIGGDGDNQPQFDGVKDFFVYINEYRKNNPDHLFNRVSIIADVSHIVDIGFSFDEALYKRTIENIQQ